MFLVAFFLLSHGVLLVNLMDYDRTHMIFVEGELLITAYEKNKKSFFKCKPDGLCILNEHPPKSYTVESYKPKNGNEAKIINIMSDDKIMKKYNYGVFEHEIHRIIDQKYSLILVADNSDETGVYTRAFYINGDYGSEIHYISGTSFSQDTVNMSQYGVIRLHYDDWGSVASGVFFDEITSSTQWYYPLDDFDSACAEPFINSFTVNELSDVVILYSCDNSNNLVSGKEFKVNIISIDKSKRKLIKRGQPTKLEQPQVETRNHSQFKSLYPELFTRLHPSRTFNIASKLR